jgi:glutamate racemase
MKVGVFDSGVGGQSVANAIQAALPELEVIVREDRQHLPYGLKSPEELLGYVVPIFQSMVDEGCRAIVVACNTVTTTLIKELRGRFDVPLVGIEPMVKPAAALTKNRIIAICATPTTLASERYKQLKGEFASEITVIEPDCSDWTMMVEQNNIDEHKIALRINEVLDAGADVIVLACTHYHWIEEIVKRLAAANAQVLQPEQAVIEQLKRVLARLP